MNGQVSAAYCERYPDALWCLPYADRQRRLEAERSQQPATCTLWFESHCMTRTEYTEFCRYNPDHFACETDPWAPATRRRSR